MIKKFLHPILFLLTLAVAIPALAGWTSPGNLVPPDCPTGPGNPDGCYPPINVSSILQQKTGQFGLGDLVADDWTDSGAWFLVKDTRGTLAAGAIHGLATGDGIGVTGESFTTTGTGSGIGLWGLANGNTSKAVQASQTADGGYGIYQDGHANAKNYFKGRVGIGTTAPTAKLHVLQPNGSALTDDLVYLATPLPGGRALHIDGSGTILMDDGPNNVGGRFAVIGNTVGIGTRNDPPTLTLRLDVRRDGTSGGGIRLLSDSDIASTDYQLGRSSGNSNWGVAGGAGVYSDVATQGDIVLRAIGEDLILSAKANGKAIRFTTGGTPDTEKMTILSGGNVGIGNASPAAKLDVNGEVKLGGVSADGPGKVVCVKSTGDLGTCSDAPNPSGACTCS